AEGDGATSIGKDSKALGDGSTGLGNQSNASGDRSTALGNQSNASGNRSTSLGNQSNASGDRSTALGDQSRASGQNSVALGAGSVADEANTVSVGSSGHERRITNVAAGVHDTDAVNVSQLNSVRSQISAVERGAYSGLAAATALTMIPDVGDGKTLTVGVGTANYKGYQAVAIGATAHVTQNIKVRSGISYSADNMLWGAGMAYQW
ncbi:TPA: YadA-like family protein, partial [Burkholderia vietnamiensis]|nr:YadA-like family protein [Burkholderia vietnamiensis]